PSPDTGRTLVGLMAPPPLSVHYCIYPTSTNPYIYGALGSFITGFVFQKLFVTILFGMLTFFIFKVLLSI
ncbi:MAG: hypothetical protein ACO3N5_11590, partial [bacterium]